MHYVSMATGKLPKLDAAKAWLNMRFPNPCNDDGPICLYLGEGVWQSQVAAGAGGIRGSPALPKAPYLIRLPWEPLAVRWPLTKRHDPKMSRLARARVTRQGSSKSNNYMALAFSKLKDITNNMIIVEEHGKNNGLVENIARTCDLWISLDNLASYICNMRPTLYRLSHRDWLIKGRQKPELSNQNVLSVVAIFDVSDRNHGIPKRMYPVTMTQALKYRIHINQVEKLFIYRKHSIRSSIKPPQSETTVITAKMTSTFKRSFPITHITTASAILHIDGINFLTDSVFSPAGTENTKGPATQLEDIPVIDAVLLSHEDHPITWTNSVGAFLTAAGYKTEPRNSRLLCETTHLPEATFGERNGLPNAIYISGDTKYHVSVAISDPPLLVAMDGKEAGRLFREIGADVLMLMHYESWEDFAENRDQAFLTNLKFYNLELILGIAFHGEQYLKYSVTLVLLFLMSENERIPKQRSLLFMSIVYLTWSHTLNKGRILGLELSKLFFSLPCPDTVAGKDEIHFFQNTKLTAPKRYSVFSLSFSKIQGTKQ
ncbi:hypothetical protein CCUS01_00848 [Colletotrichum cuscutae]|uniref:Metallo-beta-lactamase domain-containing protein n=1 Tax=Colletotrichum cuscutae TaxID=1209917 RepID=A0AAI9V4P0_9PEZI|nr:hypothetical protein CCUS01_00848 [Colletotrichum cuscutae]